MRPIKDEFGLYSESFFDDLVCRERKRSERSQKPFVLIMVEINILAKAKHDLRSLVGIFEDCFRDSDIKGWYKERSVIGIVCPEAANSTDETIKKKFENTLEREVPPTVRSILNISYTWFPISSIVLLSLE